MDLHERSGREQAPAEQQREAVDLAAPRAPLTLVSAAAAGDDLAGVAGSAAQALGRPVAIAIPSLGEPITRPEDTVPPESLRAISSYALATALGQNVNPPPVLAGAVSVVIGTEVVGIVAALDGTGSPPLTAEDRAWLEASAAAAAVAAVMHDTRVAGLDGSRKALMASLLAEPPADLRAMLGDALRLGVDLSTGAIAICALDPGSSPAEPVNSGPGVLFAELQPGCIYGLIATADADRTREAARIAATMSGDGLHVGIAAARRDPAQLHIALREAELLAALAATPGAAFDGQEETYRLLIGVMLRDRDELEQLRAHTISPLAEYDGRHDTDLLATLLAFLAHDGSTTETAEALELHRHTVGYRLARVHEVSGLSPYESEGRERLSLGLKAHHILEASARIGA